MRWSGIPKAPRRKPQGKTLAPRAREREASRKASAFEEFADRLSKLRPGERAFMANPAKPVPTKDVIAEETATLEAKNRFRQRYEEWRDAVQAVQAAEMRAKAVDKFEKLNSDGDIN